MSTDLVTLVNEHDQPIGSMDKVEAHRGQGKLHRAISVFLVRKNANGQLETLIQQRSADKIVGALQWANTCCGNVRPDETYLECAQRRLREELGIGLDSAVIPTLEPVTKFTYQVQCNELFSENEIDQIYVGWFDGEVVANPAEVADTKWVQVTELAQAVQAPNVDANYVPWLKLLFLNVNLT